MTTAPENPRPYPVTSASRLASALSRQGLAELVDHTTATDIEVIARFTIAQHTCDCGIDEQTHIVGYDCPPHPLAPRS